MKTKLVNLCYTNVVIKNYQLITNEKHLNQVCIFQNNPVISNKLVCLNTFVITNLDFIYTKIVTTKMKILVLLFFVALLSTTVAISLKRDVHNQIVSPTTSQEHLCPNGQVKLFSEHLQHLYRRSRLT